MRMNLLVLLSFTVSAGLTQLEKEKVPVNDNVHFLNPTTSGYAIIID